MKRLLFSLLFLLPFSSSVDAGPWTQMIKGGLKGGLKNNQSTNNKKRKSLQFLGRKEIKHLISHNTKIIDEIRESCVPFFNINYNKKY